MDEKEVETQNNTLTIEISNEISSETKDDIFDNIKEPRKEIEKHKKSIDRIFVSQYMDDTSTYNEVYGSDDYVVTYSKEDKSFLGWSVKNNGPQQPDVYFKADQIEDLNLRLGTLLSKKILSLYGYNKHWLIDLNSDRTNNERFLKLKQPVDCEKNIYQFFSNDAIGFLPNDLIQVSVRNRKIYKYCLKDRPINTVLWEYSQINDIEIPESLYGQVKNLRCTICRTKLFLIVKGCKTTILQFDLLKMNLERQYIANANSLSSMVVMNTNQTLLAYYCFIFSMKNGMLISYENYGEEPVEFITLKNNSERLVMNCYSNVHKLIDPYQAYDEIDISNDFNKTSVITKLNRKIFIDNGNVCVRNGSDENKLQQLSNEVIYRNSIYTSSVFKIIQSMFKEIIDRADIKKVASPDDKIKLKNRDLYEYILRPNDIYDEISFEHNDIISCCIPFPHILSYKLLNNQDLIIISMEAIEIFALLDKGFKNRYFWKNNDWNDIYKKFEKDRNSIYDINFVNEHYKPLIGRILKYEFNDSKHSIPLPNFMGQNTNHRKTIAEDVISDNLVSSKFGIEMLKIAIKENCDSVVRPIINNTIESIQNYSVNSMTFISLNLPKLCDDYPDYIIKYISYTSIILSPFCDNIRNSKNTSIHSYTNIYIKESHMDKNVFKAISSIYKWLIQHLRIKEEIQTVSFIVPFPQICVYQDDSKKNDHENHVNENNDHENENNDPENCDFNNNDYESHASKNNDHENHETENDDYENQDSKNNDHENRETGKNHDIKSKIITILILILKKMITGLKIIMMIPKSNSIWNEFLYKSKSILFCNIDSNHFYNWWNFAAIIDFKWETFGRVYYYLIWLFYTIFYVCYSLASTLELSDFYFKLLFIISIIFGSTFLIFEIRQILWNYEIYFNDIWNLFDVGAYLLPIITSIIWLINKSQPLWLMAISIILLSFKFLLFFRVIESFGIYFAIIIGVAKRVFPFLVLLFFIVLGYAQAFFIVLKSNITNDGSDNLFNWFPTSLLAVYKLITGDSGSLSSFTYRENPTMTVLLVTFTFFTVIYLMNLFIGLLNLAIGDYNKKEEYLLQKAKIIMEIELFYMLPWQRNNKKWFPNWIYYDLPVTEARKLINAIDNEQTVFNYPPIISEELRNLVVLTDDNNKLENKIDQTKEELKQQMEFIMKNIGVEKDNEEEQDSEEQEQENKLEKQMEQTKEELPKQHVGLKQQMDKHALQMDKLALQMDKLNQQMENIMELLLKRN
ncbi:hypothetical protein RhiirA4_539200 [Rhizophagus irregularis]|uniref:Ion transport domain-containing protein n=1 Tax=Rhizophagus irregularis TaxID=588596 RepID=A0A2I1G2Q1_9GLOM|nr:hypothetical protein RhiirA4_539200 [Rhizophagus irregularis]